MKRLLTLLAASVVLLAACGDDYSTTAGPEAGAAEETKVDMTTSDEAPASEPRTRRGPLVKLRASQLGPVLFDGRDRALYLFTRDRARTSRCYGACATAWPPFYARGRPRAAKGVDAGQLGTVKRRDGRRQVTYKGQPLYFYVDDPRGQVLCNDIVEFGGTWFALNRAGDPPA